MLNCCEDDGKMSEIIKEYGGMIIASIVTITFFALVSGIIFSKNGLLCMMIAVWQNGGC